MAVISSQPNDSRSRLFAKGRQRSKAFLFALLLSLILLIGDFHYKALDGLRCGFLLFLGPVQYIVDYPSRAAAWWRTFFRAKEALREENEELKYQQMVLETQLQKLAALTQENRQLRALLSVAARTKRKAMVAQILAIDTSSAHQLIVIGKGTRDGIIRGQPVLDAKGVMGQVIDVGFFTSTVLLISDLKSAVPIRNNRTGEHAILVGSNEVNLLSLIHLPRTSDIAKGDLLVTSGLGQLYPEGYPVGYVDDVDTIPGDEFIKVKVRPVALLNRNKMVLLIWPEEKQKAVINEIKEHIAMVDQKV